MKKHFLPIAIFVCMALNVGAQTWQATNLATFNYPVGGVQSHKGDLYATLADLTPSSLYKLDAGGTSWTKVTTSQPGPRMIQSADDRIYVSTLNSGVLTLLYHSFDGGQTLILDTVGLGQYLQGSISLIGNMQYHHGKMIIGQANNYFVKDTGDIAWTNVSNQANPLNSAVDPLVWFNDTLYAYNNISSSLYISADYGAHWFTRPTTLPAGGFTCHVMTVDDVSGRLYAAGSSSNNTVYGLYYSDDHGSTWTLANTSAFIGTNYNHTQQMITAMYASGQTFYMALENNADPSEPDVVGTTTGFANLAYDTLGLPTIGGAANGAFFTTHQNKLVMALNVRDVYIKGTATGIAEAEQALVHLTIYPNPANNYLHVSSDNNTRFASVKVTGIDGKVIIEQSWNNDGINVSGLPQGIYFIQLTTADKVFDAFKFVKD